MVSTRKTMELIDKVIYEQQESSFRSHLGASVIGRKCTREIWYIHRWARLIRQKPRICRLFEQGDIAEERFERWFKAAGIKIWTKDKNGKQFRISDVHGHFGGSMDGAGKGLPDLPAQRFIFEFKTHNKKSFTDLVKNKVKKSKWEHYVQMQVYMYKKGIKFALYCAINKNDDSLHFEIIKLDKKVAEQHLERARFIVFTDEPPIRISNNKRWFECLTCDFHPICHTTNELPHINCRTCAHSTPLKNGSWSCQLKQKAIKNCPKEGCDCHVYNPHMLNGAQVGDGNLKENWINIQFANGQAVKHGPDFVDSHNLLEVYRMPRQ